MSKIKAVLHSIYINATVRKDVKDIMKVVVGVVAAHFGLQHA